MSALDILLIAALLTAAGLALRSLRRGGGGCGSCSHCAGTCKKCDKFCGK